MLDFLKNSLLTSCKSRYICNKSASNIDHIYIKLHFVLNAHICNTERFNNRLDANKNINCPLTSNSIDLSIHPHSSTTKRTKSWSTFYLGEKGLYFSQFNKTCNNISLISIQHRLTSHVYNTSILPMKFVIVVYIIGIMISSVNVSTSGANVVNQVIVTINMTVISNHLIIIRAKY